MKQYGKKIKLSVLFYYLAYALLIIETMLSRIDFINYNKQFFLLFEILFLITSFILGINKNEKRIKTKKMFFYIISLIVGVASYTITKNSIFIMALLFIYCSNTIDFDDFIKFDMKFKIFMLILMIFFLQIGILDNLQIIRENGVIRNTMGFYSPNTLGIYLLNICCDYIYIHKDNISLKNYIFIAICIIINYIITNSRTSSICLVLLMLYLIMRKHLKLKKLYLVPYIFTAISFLCIYLYSLKIPFLIQLNEILSNRLLCGMKFFEEYGITFLGNQFRTIDHWIGYVYVIDNTYLNIFINHGLLLTISAYIFIHLFNKKIVNSNVCLKIIVLIYFISGLLETNLFNVIYNPFLIYMGGILLMNKTMQEDNE